MGRKQKLPRYLNQPIDKHQSTGARFLHKLTPAHFANSDDGLDIIYDLWTGNRYYGGEWEPVKTIPHPKEGTP